MEPQDPNQQGWQYTPPTASSAYPPVKTSGLAIAAFVCALSGIVLCVPLIPGLILAIMALVQINRNPRQFGGQGFAIAALVISGLAVFVVPIFAAIMFPVFARAREQARMANCLVNVKLLGSASLMYAQDYEGQYPPTGSWTDALRPYTEQARPQEVQMARRPGSSGATASERVLHCPSARTPGLTYAMNAGLSGVSQGKIMNAPNLVLLFETRSGAPASGGPELLASPPRHRFGDNFCFADGHAKRTLLENYLALVWKPEMAK